MMHWANFGGIGYGGYGLGWILMILFWTMVVLGFVYLLRQLYSGSKENHGKESAENILRKRYATDEITKDEYTEKLALIKRNSCCP